MSQNDQILSYLKSGGTLTAGTALHLFQCFRLAARVQNLRDKGHPIETRMITRRTKNGTKRYAQYSYSTLRRVSDEQPELSKRPATGGSYKRMVALVAKLKESTHE